MRLFPDKCSENWLMSVANLMMLGNVIVANCLFPYFCESGSDILKLESYV